MKKIIVTILALVYITTSTGAAIRMHYCMGQLADWGLGYNNSRSCSSCGMQESGEKENDCCQDKDMVFKNNADQKFTETYLLIIQGLVLALPAGFIEIRSNDFHYVTEKNSGDHAPPRIRGVAVYIRNCVFLI